MRTILGVIQGIGMNDVIQLSEAKAEERVQTLSLKAADPGFDKAIGDRCLVRSSDGTAIRAAKMLIKGLGEFAVAIMDQEPHVDPFILSPHAQISGLLLHPFARGVAGTWREKDLSAAQMNECEDIGGFPAQWGPDSLAEEIGGYHHVHVNSDELPPGRFHTLGQHFDLELEEPNMGVTSGRPSLLEQQQQGTQLSRKHRLCLLCARYKSSINRSPTIWTTPRRGQKTAVTRAGLGMSIPTADPQEGPCRGLAARHYLSL